VRSIQLTIAIRNCSRVAHRRLFSTFFCNSAKNDPMAALSPQAPTRPIDPAN
jgi:hypothetical protein